MGSTDGGPCVIDWDKIADDAESSPRNVLSYWLEQADEITDAIVIVNLKDGGATAFTHSELDYATVIGMLELVKHATIHDMGVGT